MKLKPLNFEKITHGLWMARSPCGIYMIQYGSDPFEVWYNCCLERDITLCPENSFGMVGSIKYGFAECQKHFEELLKPYIQE